MPARCCWTTGSPACRGQEDRCPRRSWTTFDEERLPILTVDCPYVGLEAFRDKTYFFGRECETKELLSKSPRPPIVVVVGCIGKWKVVPRHGWCPSSDPGADATPKLTIVPDFVPGNTVLQNLVDAVRAKPSPGAVGDDVAFLRQDPAHLVRCGWSKASPTLITIDQFEEVFTLSDSSDRDALVANLSGPSQGRPAPPCNPDRTRRSSRTDGRATCPQASYLEEKDLVQDGAMITRN